MKQSIRKYLFISGGLYILIALPLLVIHLICSMQADCSRFPSGMNLTNLSLLLMFGIANLVLGYKFNEWVKQRLAYFIANSAAAFIWVINYSGQVIIYNVVASFKPGLSEIISLIFALLIAFSLIAIIFVVLPVIFGKKICKVSRQEKSKIGTL